MIKSIVLCFTFVISVTAFAEESNSASLLDEGVKLFINSDYEKAERFFLEKLKDPSLEQESMIMLSRVYLASGQYDEAIDFAEKALENNPKGLDELLVMGDAYCGKAENSSIFKAFSLGRLCIKTYDEAASSHQDSATALRYASGIYLEAPSVVGGSKKKGRKFFDLLMKKFPEYAKTYQVSILEEDGKESEALELASELASRQFTSAVNQYDIARFLKKQERYEVAKKLFEPLTRMPPGIENRWEVNDSLFQLGEILIHEGNEVEAGIELIERYKQRNSNKDDYHYFWSTWSLAKAYRSIGKMDKYNELVNQIRSEDYEKKEDFAEVFDESI